MQESKIPTKTEPCGQYIYINYLTEDIRRVSTADCIFILDASS